MRWPRWSWGCKHDRVGWPIRSTQHCLSCGMVRSYVIGGKVGKWQREGAPSVAGGRVPPVAVPSIIATPEQAFDGVEIPDTLPLDQVERFLAARYSNATLAAPGVLVPRHVTRWVMDSEGMA